MKDRHLHSKKALRAALLVLLLSVVGMTKMYASYDFSAVCETGQTLYYNITDAENHYVALTYPSSIIFHFWMGYAEPTGDMVLPENIQYNGVTYSVTSIGDWAFSNCSGLNTIEIPNSVTSIGNSAFQGCTGLNTIEIPNLVTSIGSEAFHYCSGLNAVYYTGDIHQWCNIQFGDVYANPLDYAHNLFINNALVTDLVIPETVTEIKPYAFCGATCIATLIISNFVTSIGSSAFSGCTHLTSIEIPSSVTIIENSTFSNCYGLTSVEIPNSITSIGSSAFSGCSGLTTIEIPNSVTSIGSSAFSGCTHLTSIEIPSSVTIIENSTFSNCYGLTSVEIPNSITSIGSSAFSGCSGLTTIEIPNSVTSIGSSAFSGCSGLTTIEIPNSVTSIGSSAFYYCIGLTTIEIPNSVTSIGGYAFYYCSSLTTIEISNSVTSIGDYAFYGCSGLTSITILADNPPTLGNNYLVFFNVNKSIPVYVPCESVETYTEANWGGFNNLIGLCGGTVTVAANPEEGGLVIGDGVFGVGESCTVTATANEGYAFAFWTKNETMVSTNAEYTFYVPGDMDLVAHFVPDGNITFADANVKARCIANWDNDGDGELSYAEAATVTNLGTVFKNSSNLTAFDELQYFVGLTSIDSYVFSNCRGLTSIKIPNSATSIGSSAFEYCGSLTSIEIPNSVTFIGGYAFYNCTGLGQIIVDCGNTVYDSRENCNAIIKTNINELVVGCKNTIIPNSVISIGSDAFRDCSSLTSIEIPNSVTTIGNTAFYGCSGLNTIEISNSVTSIGSSAFYGCSGLTSIEIPNSVTSIGSSAFENCGSLTSIEIPNSVTSIGSFAFCDCRGLTSIEIPNTVTSINSAVFWGCSGLTSLEIPNSVTCIGDFAFCDCYGLTSIEIPNSVTSIYNTAFAYCSGLEQIIVDLGNSVYDSRENCNAIIETSNNEIIAGCKNTVIPNSVTSIGRSAFYGCRGLTTIEIPNSVISIGTSAFFGCSGLTTIEIPNLVTSIGSFAFYNCSSLTSMTVLADNPPTLNYDVFYNVNKSIPVYVPCGSMEAYQNANGWNLFTNIQEICPQTQTINLAKGWNWWSSYIELSDIDGLGLLENSIGIPNVRIESKDGDYVRSKVRNGRTVWVGALTSINNEEMYKINTKETCTATIEGQVANPANHPITINRGWNWIGFPCSESVSVNVAMSGFSPKKNDMIKGKDGSATYSNGTWSGTLNTLEPGKGYMYGSKSNATKTLVFQTGNRGEATLANITPENNYYQPVEDYADNMTLIAVVELDGVELRSNDYEMAAFVGDECRGSVKLMYVEPIDRYVAFLTVFGDQEEELRFQLTDGFASSPSIDRLTYATDDILGELDNPVVLHFGPMDVEENALADVKIYPNPSEGIFNIEGQNIRKVEVFNALGQPVCSMDTENGYLKLDLTNRASGIYLIRVISDDGIQSHQIMKR